MKVAKLYSFNDIRIEDIPIPEVGPGDALLKTKTSGICSGDVMPWYIEKKAPLVLGHEPSGEIVEVGKNVKSFTPGDRVFVHHHAPCLACRHCRKGDYVQCETWKNTKIIPGGISEYILIPEINLKNDTLKLPENVSYEDGTLVEPTACVLKGFKRAGFGFKNPSLIPPLLRGEKKGGEEGLSPSLDGNASHTFPSIEGKPSLHFPSLDGNPSPTFPSLEGKPSLHFPSLEGRGGGEGVVCLYC